MGEFDHPPDAKIHLDRVSHLITKLWMEGNKVMGTAEVLEGTTYGTSAPVGAVATITTDMTVATAFTLESGQSGSINVWIGSTYAELSPGTTVNIKIHSAGGMDYIKLIELI